MLINILFRPKGARGKPHNEATAGKLICSAVSTLSTHSPIHITTNTAIPQVEDHSSSDNEGSDDDREDVGHLQSNPASITNNNSSAEKELGNQHYTKIWRKTRDDPNIYEIPVNNDISIDSVVTSVNYRKASPDSEEHQADYIRMSKSVNSTTDLMNGQDMSVSWVRRTLRRTFHRRYMAMKMVGMNGKCSGSHKGARRFFTFSGVVIFILLMALVGVVIGAASWVTMKERTDMIASDLNNYTTSLTYCRIGRNWTTVSINRSSRPFRFQIQPVNSTVFDIPLDNLTQLALTKDVISLGASQLLLYVVVCSSATSGIDLDRMMLPPSYVNIALWTQSPGSKFKQYMALLNDVSTPQIVSRNLWFPLSGTDNHFYVNAELIDVEEVQDVDTLYFRLYLAGYC